MASDYDTPKHLDSHRQTLAAVAQQDGFRFQPYSFSDFTQARERLDPLGWIPWQEITSVLCLATAGGRESALFASLGYGVTAAGSPPLQLQLDRTVAQQNGFEIECIDCDIPDNGHLRNRTFDLVYQGSSSHYTARVRRQYQSVHNVLRPGGYYRVEHRSPFPTQLAAMDSWDGEAYRLAESQCSRAPVPSLVANAGSRHTPGICWQHIHSLDDLIGGFCDSGFTLLAFGEGEPCDPRAVPGTREHIAAYLPPGLTLFGQRSPA